MTEVKIRVVASGSDSFTYYGPFSDLLTNVRTFITETEGKILDDKPEEGFLVGRWKYGINMGGVRVRVDFRTLEQDAYAVSFHGYLADSLDVVGGAKRQAQEVAKGILHAIDPNAPIAGDTPPPATSHTPPPAALPLSNAQSPAPPQYLRKPVVVKQGMGVSAFVFALGSIIIPIAGLVGLILGVIAVSTSTANTPGRGLAVSAIILGPILAIVFAVLWAALL